MWNSCRRYLSKKAVQAIDLTTCISPLGTETEISSFLSTKVTILMPCPPIIEGCKSSSELFYDTKFIKEESPDMLKSEHFKANVFSSRDLDTLYSNKKKVMLFIVEKKCYSVAGYHRSF